MVDRVHPSGVAEADPLITAGVMRHGGGDWIVPDGEEYYADDTTLANPPLAGFSLASPSGSSHDVTINTGEAFVGGAWLGRDTQTTVSIDEQVTNQTIYLGWKPRATHKITIGRDDAAESVFSDKDPRVPIFDISTNGSGVTETTDRRTLGETINVRNEGTTAHADSATEAKQSAAGSFSIPPQAGSGEGGQLTLEGGTNSPRVMFDSYYKGTTKQARLYGEHSEFRIDGNILLSAALLANGHDLRDVGVLSATNANVGGSPVLTADGSQHWGATQDAGGNNLINLGDPAGAQHAVTLSYLARHYSSVDAREAFKAGLAVTDGNFNSTLHITVNDAPNGSNIQIVPNRNGFKFGKIIENRALDDNWKLYGTPLTEKGAIVSGDSDYKIVKNGPDGNGIINFRT